MGDYWKDNNIVKPKQVVVCAANRYDDMVICGARHYDKAMRSVLTKFPDLNKIDCEQGFIDQFGDFLTREEAMIVARESGQKINLKGCGGSSTILFSEGLY